MSNVNDVLYFLDVLAPFDTSMGFDNTGILVGGKNKKVSKILPFGIETSAFIITPV